jgi:hypothetical protein
MKGSRYWASHWVRSPTLTIDEPQSLTLTPSIGIRCGSSSIDESFKHWLIHHWPDDGAFKTAAVELELTTDEVLNKAIGFFQRHKEAFPHIPASPYEDITIPPKRGRRVEAKEVYLD